MVSTPAFIGGALSFKGDKKSKKKAKKKKQTVKHEVSETTAVNSSPPTSSLDEDMTEAERKASKKKKERELAELEQVAKMSHRERIEVFNAKLNELTELNDIPRVSAAGNG